MNASEEASAFAGLGGDTVPESAAESVVKHGLLVADNETYTIHDWTEGDLTLSLTQLKKGQQTRGHSHDNAEVYFFLRGYGRITIGRQRYLAFKDDVFFIPPGAFHQVKDLGSGLEFLCVFAHRREETKPDYNKTALG
jgi:mannose-6-phosphate isomerase-like protein (cupin superfamily)